MGAVIYIPGSDFSENNLGKVTLSGSVPIESITINGAPSVVAGGKYTYTLNPILTTQRGVTWSIVSGSEYASITQNGDLLVNPGADGDTVIIRATSDSNPSVYGEKTVAVTGGVLASVDWLSTDGVARMVIPMSGKSPKNVKKITLTFTITNTNGYMMSAGYSSSASGQTVFRAFLRNTGYMAYVIGESGYSNGPTRNANIKYRYVYEIVGQDTTGAVLKMYNADTDELLHTSSSYRAYLNSDICLFRSGWNSSGAGTAVSWGGETVGYGKFYGIKIEKANGEVVYDFVPKTYDGEGVLYDAGRGVMVRNYASSGSFNYGNDE